VASEKTCYVYEHWRPDKNACFYVGKGTYHKRAYDMRNRSRWHKAVTSKLTALGLCVDVRLIAEGLSETDAFKTERETIARWREVGAALVNITPGGEGKSGGIMSEATRQKMRESAHRRNQDPEYRAKLSAATTRTWQREGFKEAMAVRMSTAQRGKTRKPCSEETKRKIAKANTGKPGHPMSAKHRAAIIAARKGKPLSEETKRRISAGNTGKIRSEAAKAAARANVERIADLRRYAHLGPQSRRKRVVCVDDGREFPSIKDAAAHYGLCDSAIGDLCKGRKNRKTAGRLVFKYADAA
jgi:hypothetical protein